MGEMALTYHCDLDLVAGLDAEAGEVVGVVWVPLIPSVVGDGAGGRDGEVQPGLQNGGAAGAVRIPVLAGAAPGENLGFRGMRSWEQDFFAKMKDKVGGGRGAEGLRTRHRYQPRRRQRQTCRCLWAWGQRWCRQRRCSQSCSTRRRPSCSSTRRSCWFR